MNNEQRATIEKALLEELDKSEIAPGIQFTRLKPADIDKWLEKTPEELAELWNINQQMLTYSSVCVADMQENWLIGKILDAIDSPLIVELHQKWKTIHKEIDRQHGYV
tara:strand:+ start:200 stop:523 length:324 start_codon:yes stop_codon:yes gene_type:complete